jgi:uncharacterized protein (TIGR02246 family)
MKAFRLATVGAVALAAFVLATAQEADRQPISIELLVPGDAQVEFDGNKTTEIGERRTFTTPSLGVGKEYHYRLTVTSQGKVVKREITVSHKGKNSFDLRPDFVVIARGAQPAGGQAPVSGGPRGGQQGTGGSPEAEAAIQKLGEAFVEAFQKGDARAVAACWAPDGDLTDENGHQMKGRAAIEKALAELFAQNKGLKMRIESQSLRFLTPDSAIEDGISEVLPPDGGPPSRARYTNVHAKKDGQWLLGSVRETPFVPPGNYEHLRGLEWAVGDWAGEAEQGGVERLSVAWADNQNFLNATFSTTIKNISVGKATQWIGWDPVATRVRSWIFDTTGGFGDGSWTQDGGRWVVKTSSVLQDGKKAAATYVLTPVDADTITLQARDRSEDGNRLPDMKEVKLKRAK